MKTQALIPHRDIVLKLSKASKSIIRRFNQDNKDFYMATPIFPLWAFSESFPTMASEKINQAWIEGPVFSSSSFHFTVTFFSDSGQFSYAIRFAETKSLLKSFPDSAMQKKAPNLSCLTEIQRDFPLKMPCYKTGTAVIENNSWKLFEEKWHKV